MSRDRDRKLEPALKHELRAAGTPDREACVDAEALGAWADGGLDATQMASVELHVATCARCQAIVGATARSAPVSAVSEAPSGFSVWKWWLGPIAAGAAAVMLWMVVPQGTMQSPAAPAPVVEARKEAPAAADANKLADAGRKRDNAPPARFEDRPGSREEFLERKQENAASEQAAIGSVAAAPAAPAPKVSAPAPAGMTLQQDARTLAPLEIVSPDPRRRWRVVTGTIERSVDSGTSWTPVHAAAGDTVTGGTAPTGSICWLIGANGIVLITADGTTFARVPVPERVNLSSIAATDARSATVTAADGRQFRTDDSGRTWRRN